MHQTIHLVKGECVGRPSAQPALVFDDPEGRACVDIGPISIHGDADELEVALSNALHALRAERGRDTERRGSGRAGGGGEADTRTAARLADEVAEGDVLVIGADPYEEHWTVESVEVHEARGQVTVRFLDRAEPLVAYATTVLRVLVDPPVLESGEPFVADRASNFQHMPDPYAAGRATALSDSAVR